MGIKKLSTIEDMHLRKNTLDCVDCSNLIRVIGVINKGKIINIVSHPNKTYG